MWWALTVAWCHHLLPSSFIAASRLCHTCCSGLSGSIMADGSTPSLDAGFDSLVASISVLIQWYNQICTISQTRCLVILWKAIIFTIIVFHISTTSAFLHFTTLDDGQPRNYHLKCKRSLLLAFITTCALASSHYRCNIFFLFSSVLELCF